MDTDYTEANRAKLTLKGNGMRVVYFVLILCLFTSFCHAQSSRLKELIRQREMEIRNKQQNPSTPPQAKFCSNCGNALAPEVKFCASCGTKVAGGIASPAPQPVEPADVYMQNAQRVLGYWVAQPPIVTLPVHEQVYAHTAQMHVLEVRIHRGRLQGRYTYTDYRRFFESPSLHRNDIEERQRAKEFPVDFNNDDLIFGFDAHLHNKVFRRSARVNYKRHYVWSFRLTLSEDGQSLTGVGEKDFYREKVVFKRVSDKEGAWLLNQRNRRRRLEEGLKVVGRALRADMSAVADTVEGATLARLVQALAVREVWFFNERDNLISRINLLQAQNLRLTDKVKDLGGDPD